MKLQIYFETSVALKILRFNITTYLDPQLYNAENSENLEELTFPFIETNPQNIIPRECFELDTRINTGSQNGQVSTGWLGSM